MRKPLYLLMYLVLIISNIFAYTITSNKQLIQFLYSGQFVHIKYDGNSQESELKLLTDHIHKFSTDNNVNISQYSYLSDKEVNIYSTNIKSNSTIHLEAGEIPNDNTYISNKKLNSMEQSGVFTFPLTNWEIRIYNFEQIKNVGLKGDFHLNTLDKKIVDSFIKEFEIYGDISLLNENVNSLSIMNRSLLMIVVFSFVVLFIGIVHFLIKNRKKALLKQLWGYSKKTILFDFPKSFLFSFPILLSLLFIFICTFIFMVLFKQLYYMSDYIFTFIITNSIILIAFILLSIIANNAIQRFNMISKSAKGISPFKKMQWISAITKVITSTLLFIIITSAFTNIQHLYNKMNSLEYWNQTYNIFRIKVDYNNDKLDDLRYDRVFNDRLSDFYQEIQLTDQAFIIESNNFIPIKYIDGEPVYSYTMNSSHENEGYNVYGRRIVINNNYLNVNPIKGTNGKNILNQIQNDENVLNLLVPEQLESIEKEIIHSYREYFYFCKIIIDNYYNEEIGYPINEESIENLYINIIYTEKEQNYFTFNALTGDNNNQIKDPIAIIYNNSVDTSFIASYMTSLYFYDDSSGNAFKKISPVLADTNVSEIKSVQSVYGEANNQIVRLKWLLFQQLISFIIIFICSIILFITMIYAFYNTNIYKLNLKYLFGYSYWKKNQEIIIITIITYIISSLIIFMIYGISKIILIVILIMILDLIFINKLNNHLIRSNINKL